MVSHCTLGVPVAMERAPTNVPRAQDWRPQRYMSQDANKLGNIRQPHDEAEGVEEAIQLATFFLNAFFD